MLCVRRISEHISRRGVLHTITGRCDLWRTSESMHHFKVVRCLCTVFHPRKSAASGPSVIVDVELFSGVLFLCEVDTRFAGH